ncbi:MAG TPA: hypothetical protein VIF38_03835 [Burkholderiales bacterium]|jgi:hypothetical protein
MLDPQLSALLSQLGYDPATVESLLRWAAYLTVASLVAAIPTGVIAKRKGRSVTGWVVFELCIPVVPLLVVWLLPAKEKSMER